MLTQKKLLRILNEKENLAYVDMRRCQSRRLFTYVGLISIVCYCVLHSFVISLIILLIVFSFIILLITLSIEKL